MQNTGLVYDFRDEEFIPLFCNHSTDNEDEILRLCHLGLDLQIKQPCPHLPDARLTRYIIVADYLVSKFFFRENKKGGIFIIFEHPAGPRPDQASLPAHVRSILKYWTRN